MPTENSKIGVLYNLKSHLYELLVYSNCLKNSHRVNKGDTYFFTILFNRSSIFYYYIFKILAYLKENSSRSRNKWPILINFTGTSTFEKNQEVFEM